METIRGDQGMILLHFISLAIILSMNVAKALIKIVEWKITVIKIR